MALISGISCQILQIRAENSPPRLLYDVPSVIHGRPINGLLLPPGIPSYVKRFPPGFEAGFIVQPLDHFNTTREQILLQNFWHNPEYYKKGGPVFLMISGDNDGKISWLLNPEVHIARCAKKFGASIFLLEHRYYGKSKPHTINGTNDLRWLTSRQALEDIALFIRSTSRDRKYKNARWIIFGGSYAGALSAWFRQLHPELAIGAIASSAPLQAKVDFYEHLMVTQRAIKRHDEQCLRNIGEAFKLVYLKTFTKDGKMNLTNEYKLTQSFNETSLPVDFAYFFSIIYGYFQAAVQYSGVNVEYYAAENMIKNICDMMTKKGSLFNNIVEYHKSMVEFYEKEFNHTENSYQSLLEYYKEPSPARFWLYQTCTEFGYYLSTDLGRNVFGTTYPISFDLKLCRDVFGSDFTADTIHRAVKKTNDYYGGADNYKGTNVVMINGDIDPWSALGHYKERETVVNYLVEGSAHCADMYPSREEDVPGLAVARKIIEDNIEKWIEQSAPPPTEKPTETTTETTKGHSPSTKQTKTTRKIQTTKGHSPSTKQTKTTRKIQTTTTSGSESLTLKILFTLMFPFLAFSLRCCR
ncbi:hypothetical protein AB6A40_004212 [Gnathostoma spinigerum]|uniref:Uncharacterized protein n=1 Tax=Gnathostoma spinigerum TaxID=75299 RepID=A0ABD6EKL0_9BILA